LPIKRKKNRQKKKINKNWGGKEHPELQETTDISEKGGWGEEGKKSCHPEGGGASYILRSTVGEEEGGKAIEGCGEADLGKGGGRKSGSLLGGVWT